MHRHLTHNRSWRSLRAFADAVLGVLREKVPARWAHFCDSVTDNFHIIDPKTFRVLA